MDLNEYFPTLKYGCPARVPPLPVTTVLQPIVDFDTDERKKPALTSALKAGWICFGLGLAVAWIFPPAFLFYSIALILAVVAMCMHQVNKGLALLLSTFIGMGTSAMISFFLAVGLFAAAVGPAVAKANKEMERQREVERQLIVTQEKALSQLNQAFTNPPATRFQVPHATPIPIQSMNKRQMFDEIARIEKEKRDLRRIGRDVPLETEDYLEKLKTALDAGS